MQNIAVVRPMPSARATAASAVVPGCFRSERIAIRTSRENCSMRLYTPREAHG
jgi:hypothetical protein